MVSSKNARCAALLLLAVLLISFNGMGDAARGLEETVRPVPEDDYPAEATETPEEEQSPSFPEFGMPPFPAFPKVELPPMPEMPAIPGFHFSEPEPEPEADEP